MTATPSAKSLSSSFFALLFAAGLLLGGCSANLAGPDAPADAPAKVQSAAPQVDAPHNNGKGTTTGASHNEVAEMS